MRLVKVAKALNMTGQQLRHELESVDFGVKATDREIPDSLAQGIVRFIARKHGLEVDMDSLGFEDQPETDNESPQASAESPAAAAPAKERRDEESVSSEGLKVLRKLTLEDVSKEAIAKEKKKLDAQQPANRREFQEAQQEDRAASRVAAGEKKKEALAVQEQIKQKRGTVVLPAQLTVKEFAEKAGVQIPRIIQALMQNGIMATINQTIDFDTAAIMAADLGIDVQREESVADVEHLLSKNLAELLKEDDPAKLQQRPPIIVVMGHVDHGKTSILDAIRQTDVAAGEAGGITQHIGAYQVAHIVQGSGETKLLTFLDTPGHEAFTAMRARGAQVTDVAVIVVAADEGVKPTTIEAINHAKEAGVPVIVAINKMDKEGADPERVKGELAGHGLQAENWGGDVPMVPCSAKSKLGIDTLLDTILLVSDLAELKANPDRNAVATVIESHLDPSMGALATVIVNTGTLRKTDAFICGRTYGKIRAMMDAHAVRTETVRPSGAVRISGFEEVPQVGDILQVMPSEQEARSMMEEVRRREEQRGKRSFADLVSRLSEGKVTQLKVVLKTDTQGSLEAVKEALSRLATEGLSVKVIHGAVGAVSENDIMMAAASEGVVIGFHVTVPGSVQQTADREGVQVREYDVVYTLLEEVDALLKGLVIPEEEEKILGHLEVKQVFLTKKSEQIVGGKVTDGVIKRLPFRLQRDGQLVGTGRITSLKKVDKDIKEAPEGSECGMRVDTTLLILEGDVLEVYSKELKRRS
jgi:translation initiation factor IF-2